MDFNLKTALQQSRHWGLNTIILKDEEFTSNFSTELKALLEINTLSTSNASILLETCKAYARGLIILCSASKKCQRQEKQKSLESELMNKEKAYIASPSPPLWQEIMTLRSVLNCLLTRDAEKKMKYPIPLQLYLIKIATRCTTINRLITGLKFFTKICTRLNKLQRQNN